MKHWIVTPLLLGGLAAAWAQSCEQQTAQMVSVTDPQTGQRLFWLGRYEVTNAEFAQFVQATGYRTQAQQQGSSQTLRFDAQGHSDGQWHNEPGTSWMRPYGTVRWQQIAQHPVVHVTLRDALAYAHWKGHDLPTAQEWEMGANQGRSEERSLFAPQPRDAQGRPNANYWQGIFPSHHQVEDGYRFTAPVGSFAEQGDARAQDVVGNVWELTTTPVVTSVTALLGGIQPAQSQTPSHITIKGGSYLCAENYCQNYHTYSSAAHDASLPTMHIGFRTVLRSCL